ncbi:hypothetical protein ACO0QE_002469 [Hanseniaspora vineae]
MNTPVARHQSNFFPPQSQYPQPFLNQQPPFSSANMNHSGSHFSGNANTNINNKNMHPGVAMPSTLAAFAPAVSSPAPSHTPVSAPPIDGFFNNKWNPPIASPAVQPIQQSFSSNPGTPLFMHQQLNPTAGFHASQQQQQQQEVPGQRAPSLFFPQDQSEADKKGDASSKNVANADSSDNSTGNNASTLPGDNRMGNFPVQQPLGPHSGPPQPPPLSFSSKPVFSQWKYIDTQENWQGPFSSANMDNWLRGGYFMDNLQVLREVEGNQGPQATDQQILPFGIKNRCIFYLGQLTSQYKNHLIQTGQQYAVPPTSPMYSPFQHFDTVCSQITALVNLHPPAPGLMIPNNDPPIANPLPTPPSSSRNQNSILHPQHTDSMVQAYNDTQKREATVNSHSDKASILSPSAMSTSMSESALQYSNGTQTPVLGGKAIRDFQSTFSPNDRSHTGSPRLNNKLSQKSAVNVKKNGHQDTTPEEIPRTKIVQSKHSPPEFSIEYSLDTPGNKINTKENLAERDEDLNYQEIMHLYDPKQKSYYIESSLQIPFQKSIKEEYNEWPLDFYEMDDRLEDLAESIQKLKIEDEEIFKKYQTKRADMIKFKAASKRKEQEEKQKKEQEELKRLKKEQEELKKKENSDKKLEKIVQELIEGSEKEKSKKVGSSTSNGNAGSKKSKKSKKSAKKEKDVVSTRKESPAPPVVSAVPTSSPSPSHKPESEKSKIPKSTVPLAQYKANATQNEPPKVEVAKVQPVSLAPWANAQKPNINKVSSLADVLAAEKMKKKEKDLQKEKQRAALLQKKILEAKKEEELLAKKQVGAPWASAEFQSSKKKELESLKNGIDKELQLQKQLESPDFVKEQAKAFEELKKAQKLAAQEDSNWTTVEAKKLATDVKKPINIHAGANSVNPDNLRHVAKTTSATLSNKKISTGNHISIPTLHQQQSNVQSAKKGFLTWCKSEMRLNSGIKFADIIEVLLSLPDSSDGREIIADTINSNSNTMNGKRFALDFLTRRREVESNSKDFLSWSEALKIFKNGDDSDWDFQVVSKKKKGGARV